METVTRRNTDLFLKFKKETILKFKRLTILGANECNYGVIQMKISSGIIEMFFFFYTTPKVSEHDVLTAQKLQRTTGLNNTILLFILLNRK